MADNEEAYENLKEGGAAVVSVPGTQESLFINKFEQEDNVVRVWVDGNTEKAPDYVIVNPPTEVQIGRDSFVEDPLGAIATAIHGAKQ